MRRVGPAGSRPWVVARLAALAIVLFAGQAGAQDEVRRLRIAGSDTMHPLAERWAQEYMAAHPGVSVDVAGGGTARGLRALIEGRVDIATASRQLQPEEARDLMEQHGTLGYSVFVARDALSVYLHPTNPVDELTVEQLDGLFSGRIDDWSLLGGPDLAVTVVNRSPASGTRHFFAQRVLGDSRFRRRTRTEPTTDAVVAAVRSQRGAVGYGGIGAANGVKLCRIDGVAPTEEHVRDGSYPIARYLYLYTAVEPEGLVKELIAWVLSDAGQQVVAEVGYVPLRAVGTGR